MARPIKRIMPDHEVLAEVEQRARATSFTVQANERASIVSLWREGLGVAEVAALLGTTPKRVFYLSEAFRDVRTPRPRGRLGAQLKAGYPAREDQAGLDRGHLAAGTAYTLKRALLAPLRGCRATSVQRRSDRTTP